MDDRQRFVNRICAVAAAFMLAVFFWSFLVPVWDIDFWWHIATGRWIVEHRGLPDTDPFGVYPGASGPRNDVLLKGYWLSQVIFYELFEKFGPEGITVSRALILTLCLLIVYARGRTLGAGPAVSLFVTGLAGFNALGFTGERPQLFSFLFVSIAFLAVERAGKTGSRSVMFSLPAVSVVWANCHGGVALGAVLLILYLAAGYAAVKLLDKSENTGMTALAGGALAFALLTLATPNGFSLYELIWRFQGSVLQQRTSDYLSSFLIYRIVGFTPQLWVALFFAAAALSAPGLVRKATGGAALTLFMGALSAMSYRYHAFFIFAAAPYAALGLGALLEKLPMRPLMSRLAAPTAIIMAAGAISVMLMVYVKDAAPSGINPARFPADTADYMAEKKMKGRVFNFMGWGGYLIWRLDPDIRVYVDGRMLDAARLVPYTHILWATKQGREWFEKERFDYVLIPYRNAGSGEVYGLNNYLLGSGGWTPVHHGEKGILFARNETVFFTPY